MKKIEPKDKDSIRSWINLQCDWVHFLAVSDRALLKQHGHEAFAWHAKLLKAGFRFPLFVVLDLGLLIVCKANWKSWIPPLPVEARANWPPLQQRYSQGLGMVNRLIQSGALPIMPFQKAGPPQLDTVVHLILLFIVYLNWQKLHFPFPPQWQGNYAELTQGLEARWRNWQKPASQELNETFSPAHIKKFEAIFNAELKFIKLAGASSFLAASWEAAMASNWKKPEQPGKNYWQFLDYQMAQKYLANYYSPWASDVLRSLEKPAADESLLAAESRKYTSFDRITQRATVIAPSELLYLIEPTAEDFFWSKYVERSLLTLGTELREDNPSEVSINFCIPESREMFFYALAEDDQAFFSYAKYLTLLFWHDFVALYVASGCSEANLFSFNLWLHQPNRAKQWQERKYILKIREELVNFAAGYMLQLGWAENKDQLAALEANPNQTCLNLFYRPNLELYAPAENAPAASQSEDELKAHNYWLLFMPEKYLVDLAPEAAGFLNRIDVPENHVVAQLLRKSHRRYQHVLVITFNNLELYEVTYGAEISLRRMHKRQQSRAQSEAEIRKILLENFVNEILLPSWRQ